jgi:hypothetical protein
MRYFLGYRIQLFDSGGGVIVDFVDIDSFRVGFYNR